MVIDGLKRYYTILKQKKMYHKYKDLIAIYDKIKQPIKFKK